MLNTTWNRGTIVDKLSRYTFRPNGSKIYSNLLRTRKCFTTSHMHIYSIPPMSRMNFAQKRVPKLFCSDFIPVFSFSVETTFFGNDNQLPNFLNSNTFQISNWRKIDVNKRELGQSTRGWQIVRVLQFAGMVQARRMFCWISEASVSTEVRLFQTLFYKIHDSYHNFLILYAKQSICYSLVD